MQNWFTILNIYFNSTLWGHDSLNEGREVFLLSLLSLLSSLWSIILISTIFLRIKVKQKFTWVHNFNDETAMKQCDNVDLAGVMSKNLLPVNFFSTFSSTISIIYAIISSNCFKTHTYVDVRDNHCEAHKLFETPQIHFQSSSVTHLTARLSFQGIYFKYNYCLICETNVSRLIFSSAFPLTPSLSLSKLRREIFWRSCGFSSCFSSVFESKVSAFFHQLNGVEFSL